MSKYSPAFHDAKRRQLSLAQNDLDRPSMKYQREWTQREIYSLADMLESLDEQRMSEIEGNL